MANLKERTFVMVKPDGVQRGLIGKIIKRFEQKGFKLVALKLVQPSEHLLKQHYVDLADRPFFPALVKYMSSGPVVPMVWEGQDAVKGGRNLIGNTDPLRSASGTIRGDFGAHVGRNIVHGSDSIETACKEIGLWFTECELIAWEECLDAWVYTT